MKPFVRVVVADDHPVFRAGIKAVMEDSRMIEIVGEANTGMEAIGLVEATQPDVLLLDLEMPDLSGIEVAEALFQRNPHVHILIVSAHNQAAYTQKLLKIGVSGYLLKDEAAEKIVQAVTGVARGEGDWFSTQVSGELMSVLSKKSLGQKLTERELEVLQLLVEGNTNSAIAHELHIAGKTVEKHIASIYEKLNVQSRTEAAVLAVREHLTDTPPEFGHS